MISIPQYGLILTRETQTQKKIKMCSVQPRKNFGLEASAIFSWFSPNFLRNKNAADHQEVAKYFSLETGNVQ